ncbi:MAG: helix-turn-helix domain-containing protein [Candidatus Nanoarchaeia archaeon]|nr:helix-turn-helix domain-containing protein [Candidatus Nanoarchaeia archaeon]
MKQKILELIQKIGPIVPTDVSKEMGIDSYVVSALISEMIKDGLILYSHKKMTTSPLYYIKGQEDLVRKRLISILKIPEINILEYFKTNKLISRENLEPQQRYMVDELKDFIAPMILKINGEDKAFYKHYSISENEVIEKFNKWKQGQNTHSQKEEINEITHEELKEELIEENIKEESDNFKKHEKVDSGSDKFFIKNNLDIVESIIVKKSVEYDFVVKQNIGVGQTFFVKYLKKTSINDSDISKAYTAAQSKKMPCMILITGKLSKKAQDLIINLGYLVNVIKI